MKLDLTEHEGFIYSLIKSYGTEDQDKEDVFQDFYLYYNRYAKYDPEKGKPTTFINRVFANFIGAKRAKLRKRMDLENAVHVESREEGYLDRELGSYMTDIDSEIYINELLKDVDALTLSIILGDTTLTEQAEIEGTSRQAVQQRHQRRLKKITGE